MQKRRLLIFASGSAQGGGSGFENLVLKSRDGVLDADIVGVVSNHENGGVRAKAGKLGIKFIHFPSPWNTEGYEKIVEEISPDFIALSGWLKLVSGLSPRITINIHPGPLPRFGGKGMYGHYVHEAVIEAFKKGEVTHSAISMHFVTPKYDEGPLFFKFNVEIRKDDTAESLGERVNRYEHEYQPKITDLIIKEKIKWDGINPSSLILPEGYAIEQYETKSP